MYWRERDEKKAIRDAALLDAARAVDRVLVQIGALEGSSIHSALSSELEWIESRRQELENEKARILDVGRTMQLAGLRSYTDKEGRIYVAPQATSEDPKR